VQIFSSVISLVWKEKHWLDDKVKMIKALIVLSLIFVGFVTHTLTGLEPGMIALFGAFVMVFVCKAKVDDLFVHVEWDVIFFFIGLFMLIGALEYNGAIELLAGKLLALAGSNFFLLCALILCGSAIFSSIMDNIPFVITMVPMIKTIIPQIALMQGLSEPSIIHATVAQPLWWALALGACLGGNGTIIGASANVVVAKIATRNKYDFTFFRFFRYGFPFMVKSIIISLIYIWFRYFKI